MSSHEPVTALSERESPPSSPTPSESSGGITPSGAQEGSALACPHIPIGQAALAAWIDHLQRGGPVPCANTLIELLQSMLASPAPFPAPMATRADLDAKLIIVDTGKKFPHVLDTENGRLAGEDAVWTQCKTKMTHVCVRLVDSNDQPMRGTAVQQGGLKLRMTLHKVSDDEAMNDDYNPRQHEGLFLGRASRRFEPEVCLMEGRHEFRFQVMLLSSDIAGARMYVKVAPVDPQLASNPNLTVKSHSFISRARMPDESFMSREKRGAAASQLLSMALTLAEIGASPSPPASSETDTRAASPPNKRHCPAE
jgi:hypothetical protein